MQKQKKVVKWTGCTSYPASFIIFVANHLRVPTLIILKPVLDISFICTYPVYNFKREVFNMHVCIYIKKKTTNM